MTVDWFKSDEMRAFMGMKNLPPMLRTWRTMKDFLKHMSRNPTLFSENELYYGKHLTEAMMEWYKDNPYANVDPKGSANGLISMERIDALKKILMCFQGIDKHEMKECNIDWSKRNWKLSE